MCCNIENTPVPKNRGVVLHRNHHPVFSQIPLSSLAKPNMIFFSYFTFKSHHLKSKFYGVQVLIIPVIQGTLHKIHQKNKKETLKNFFFKVS